MVTPLTSQQVTFKVVNPMNGMDMMYLFQIYLESEQQILMREVKPQIMK